MYVSIYIYILYSIYINIPLLIDPYNVGSSALVPPRKEFLVRPLHGMFVKRLKLEILERPSTFCKPLRAIVNNAVAQEDFNEAKVRPLSDYDTHLNSLEAITDEMRLL